MTSRFYIKRLTKEQYLKTLKREGELFYLTDISCLASHNKIYDNTNRIDCGYFHDNIAHSKTSGVDGGEF